MRKEEGGLKKSAPTHHLLMLPYVLTLEEVDVKDIKYNFKIFLFDLHNLFPSLINSPGKGKYRYIIFIYIYFSFSRCWQELILFFLFPYVCGHIKFWLRVEE